MRHRGSAVLAIVMGRMNVVVDVLWSQLYRTERAIVKLLERNGFSVLRSTSWSNENSLNVILLELAQSTLPDTKRHVGPPVAKLAESASFLSKHVAANDTISGPWIEGNRWVAMKRRQYTSCVGLLKAALRTGGRNEGVASEPARSFEREVTILAGQSVGKLVKANPGFAGALRVFLSGRPIWLE